MQTRVLISFVFVTKKKKSKPLKALEFLAEADKEEAFKSAHPSIYNNILVSYNLCSS
jgi:hypothetical protein